LERVGEAKPNLLIYLKETFKKLIQNENFEEWVDCHAGFGRVSASYYIMEQLNIYILENVK
jgi:hypothetical protein